ARLSLPGAPNIVSLQLACLQHVFLETHARAKWLKDWLPRLENVDESFPLDSLVIGAFTDIVDSVADLFRIGIPVWFVHPWADHASVEIGCVVPPLDVDFTGNLLPIRDSDMKLDISDCNPPHPIIYSG
ncbi:hypothetical protein BDP27DRAFT_1188543, partial [Rhodocollybia butyracea]